MIKRMFLIAAMSLVLIACPSIKDKEAELYSFKCDIQLDEFVQKTIGIISYGGFEVLQSDTTDAGFVLIAQKLLSTNGTGESRTAKYDQIRFRYTQPDSNVWVSHGILYVADGKRNFVAPKPEDQQRHKETVQILIDRVYSQCNHGIFPNRP